MFDPFVSHLSPYRPHLLSVLRIMTALLFLQHATMKLFAFPPSQMPSPGLFSFFGALGVLELVGSLLLIVGFYTRLAAFVLSGEMAVAYFMAHAPHSFFPIVNMGESAVLFCFVFLYIAAAGPGAWALDNQRGAH
jgi:putative oxidoreductase